MVEKRIEAVKEKGAQSKPRVVKKRTEAVEEKGAQLKPVFSLQDGRYLKTS